MKKDPRVFLNHILEAIALIEEYLGDTPKSEFLIDKKLQDSVIRRVEVIGEAVKYLPLFIKQEYPDIPWKDIAGMRDKLIHHYFGIDMDLTWKVATKEIKILKKEIQKIIKVIEER